MPNVENSPWIFPQTRCANANAIENCENCPTHAIPNLENLPSHLFSVLALLFTIGGVCGGFFNHVKKYLDWMQKSTIFSSSCNHSNENCFVICSSYTPLHVCLNVWVPPLSLSPCFSISVFLSLSMPCKVPQPTPFKQGTFFVTPSCQGSIALAAIRSAAVRNIDSQRAWSSTAPLQFHICLPLFLSAPLCLHLTLQAGICLMPWTLRVQNPL